MVELIKAGWKATNGFKTHLLCTAVIICAILKKYGVDIPTELFYALIAAAVMALRSGVNKTAAAILVLFLPALMLGGCGGKQITKADVIVAQQKAVLILQEINKNIADAKALRQDLSDLNSTGLIDPNLIAELEKLKTSIKEIK